MDLCTEAQPEDKSAHDARQVLERSRPRLEPLVRERWSAEGAGDWPRDTVGGGAHGVREEGRSSFRAESSRQISIQLGGLGFWVKSCRTTPPP